MKSLMLKYLILFVTLPVIAFLILDKGVEAQNTVGYGQLVYSFNNANPGGAANGTTFAIPQRSIAYVTWCHDATVDPSAISISLQHSNDNVQWSAQQNSTAASGACNSVNSGARFLRCVINSITGGTDIDCNINILPNNISPGSISFGAHNTYDVGSSTVALRNIYIGGVGLFWSAAGSSLIRGQGAGILELMNSAGTGFTRLTFGPILSTSPAIKVSGTELQARVGDDSNSTGWAMRYIAFNTTAFASLGTPANGTVNYCNDCTIANPCASGGTGAIAKRLNGVWVCN